jgi:hypothetical protein
VTLYGLKSLSTQGYAVIHQDIITDYRGLTNYDTDTVVNHKAATDYCTRVDLDGGPKLGPVRKHAAQDSQL